MKKIILLSLFLSANIALGQQIDYNTPKKFIAEGYDVVAYFSNKAVKGATKYQLKYDGANYKFSSEKNKEIFKNNAQMYVPQYGGWCAYAMASKGEKVSINPKTFEIRNGKLYLFYNAFFDNTLESWLAEMPNELIKKADANWNKIKFDS